MGHHRKKRSKSSEGTVTVKEIAYWMMSTFGWTFDYLRELAVEDMYYIMEGSRIFNDKQVKEMKKSSGSGDKSGKYNVDGMNQLLSTPGVRTIKSGNGNKKGK
jgi:hypothetical protein